VRQEEMRDKRRLGRAKVREHRHQRVTRRRRLNGQRVDDRGDRPLDFENPAAQVQAQVERHLFVSRTACMQPPAGIAHPLDEPALDEAVHVFVVAHNRRRIRSALFEQFLERPFQAKGVVAIQQARARERTRPCEAPGHIVFEEASIEREGVAKFEGAFIGGAVEPTRPQCRHELVVSR